jgi:hypothetical protein
MAARDTSFTPLPGGRTPAGADSLIGDEVSAPSPPSGQQDASRDFMNVVRGLHEQIETFARQYPDMAPIARKMTQALQEGMTKHLAKGQTRSAGSASPAGLVG